MGFLDKAKKLAEQAQTKLDEVQKGFNEGQGSAQPQGPVTQYDKHGRPVQAWPSAVTPGSPEIASAIEAQLAAN